MSLVDKTEDWAGQEEPHQQAQDGLGEGKVAEEEQGKEQGAETGPPGSAWAAAGSKASRINEGVGEITENEVEEEDDEDLFTSRPKSSAAELAKDEEVVTLLHDLANSQRELEEARQKALEEGVGVEELEAEFDSKQQEPGISVKVEDEARRKEAEAGILDKPEVEEFDSKAADADADMDPTGMRDFDGTQVEADEGGVLDDRDLAVVERWGGEFEEVTAKSTAAGAAGSPGKTQRTRRQQEDQPIRGPTYEPRHITATLSGLTRAERSKILEQRPNLYPVPPPPSQPLPAISEEAQSTIPLARRRPPDDLHHKAQEYYRDPASREGVNRGGRKSGSARRRHRRSTGGNGGSGGGDAASESMRSTGSRASRISAASVASSSSFRSEASKNVSTEALSGLAVSGVRPMTPAEPDLATEAYHKARNVIQEMKAVNTHDHTWKLLALSGVSEEEQKKMWSSVTRADHICDDKFQEAYKRGPIDHEACLQKSALKEWAETALRQGVNLWI